MLNKNNNQTHYGQGNQYIDQSVTNNVFLTYGDSGSSNSTNNPGILVVIFLVITLSLGNLLLSLVQEYKQVIIMTQIVLLIIVNSYVYFKSRDIKLLITEMIPSILTVLTSVFSINNQMPANFQSVLDKINVNPDFSSWETAVNSFLNGLLPKSLELFSEYSPYTIVFTTLYIILVLLIIMTPLMIGTNALFRHSVRNYPAYVITIAYWIFFFVLKMIQ